MLEASWEKYATMLANAESDDAVVTVYNDLVKTLKINLDAPSRVVFARDTRASGSRLVECLTEALAHTATEYTDYKFATTPQLHYFVRCINTKGTQDEYGEPTEKGYYEKLSTAYKQAMGHYKSSGGLSVDCANGVGGPKLRELIKYLPSSPSADAYLDISVVNDDIYKPDTLNYQVCCPYIPHHPSHTNLSSSSAVPTLSRPANVLHPRLKPPPSTDAALLTAMLIVSSSISTTTTTSSVCLMAIALLPWPPLSSATWPANQV